MEKECVYLCAFDYIPSPLTLSSHTLHHPSKHATGRRTQASKYRRPRTPKPPRGAIKTNNNNWTLTQTHLQQYTQDIMASQWQPSATHTALEDLNSIPIQQLPLDPSSTTTHASESDHTISANSTVEHLASKIASTQTSTQTWSHLTEQPDDSPEPTTGTKTKSAAKTATHQNRNQQSIAPAASPRSPGTAPTYPTALGPDTSVQDHNRTGAAYSSRQHEQQQQQQAGGEGGEGRSTDAHPTGTPRVIVRIDRDHNIGDEATRFECEQFPEEMLGRVSIQLMAIDHCIFVFTVNSGTDSCPNFPHFSLRQPVGNINW